MIHPYYCFVTNVVSALSWTVSLFRWTKIEFSGIKANNYIATLC
jgi:hypothetical protein